MEIEVSDGRFSAFHARAVAPQAPTVVVVQEIFGVNRDIRETAEGLSRAGFNAVAPDLFWRDAPGLDLNCWSEEDWKRGLALYEAYDLSRGVSDLAATVATIRDQPWTTDKVGVMGFCLGGLMSYLTAARAPVDAAVAYYGGNMDKHLGEANRIKVPLLVHLGEEDEFISKPAQAAIRAALAGNPHATVWSYPGQSHAFARHTGTHYNAAAASLANKRTLDFFRRHLGTSR